MSNKPLIKEVTDDLFLIRVDDRRVKYFEALWEIPEGITYNAYLLRLGSGSVVFDGVKAEYSDGFIEALTSLVNPKSIRYVVVNHAEPDHTGSIKKLMELTGGKAVVLGHPMVASLLNSLYGIRPAFKAVKDGEALDLGDETLKFIHTPWLHWPETMVTYFGEEISSNLLRCLRRLLNTFRSV
jgi:flavorubredoxin